MVVTRAAAVFKLCLDFLLNVFHALSNLQQPYQLGIFIIPNILIIKSMLQDGSHLFIQ